MDKLNRRIGEIIKGVRVKHFPKGQILLYKDDMPLDIYILKSGIVKMYDEDKEGNIKILHIVKPYAILPFAFFSGGTDPIKWYYAALTDCDIAVVPKDYFNEQIKHDIEVYELLMHWFSVEVHELLVRLSSMGKTTAKGKIVAALKFLAVYHSQKRPNGWLRVTFPLNHQFLADTTGVSRERAAIIMKNLTDKNIIRNPRQTILEIDMPKLVKLN